GFMRDGMFVKVRGDEPQDIERLFALVRRDPTRTGNALFRTASEGYFRAMNIPLLRGRLFNDGDGYDAPHVAVISESLAAKEWPDQNPIGRRVQFGNMDGDLREFTVVGIVGDVRDRGADRDPQPTFYGNYAQRAKNTGNFSIVMHRNAAASSMISSARAILRELAPEMPPRFRTIEEIFSASLADRSFNLALVAVFGGTALLLAMMGVYGVMSYAVVQRTQEIGIRMALGAMGGDVVRQFLREGGKLIAIGVVLGLAGAAALGKYVASLLYNTSARDPLTFAAVGAAMGLVALIACFIPARRATRVDPMIALRHE
ncbi:MAG: FtsX-like permease family protein, partial [Candidatus Acidiferrales bacterium]